MLLNIALLQNVLSGKKEYKINTLHNLACLLIERQEELLADWRAQLKQLPCARHLDLPTLNDHIPLLIGGLAKKLNTQNNLPVSTGPGLATGPAHGLQRLKDGFEIEEVVAEYNILRGCIHDLADKNDINLQGTPFHIINRVLDEAVGSAVQTYSSQEALKVQHRREEYLAFVAHDLRTPLNAIGMAATVLELGIDKVPKPEQTRQMIKTLKRNVHQLSSLVDKVVEENINLETETGLRLERRSLDLWPLVEGLIHDLYPVAGTGSTTLKNEVSEDMVVYADASLLRRIFQNLIANAIHYTKRGEVVIRATDLPAGEGAQCSVTDNGGGIAADKLSKIFDKYESDSGSTDGFGLGLAIFKTFVDAHGGSVSVQSAIGSGSTFNFTLPAKR